MVNAVEVRVLLDTGPTNDEIEHIRRVFGRVGLTATVEGHSYGGPPPTSAFLMVVNAPLGPFLDHFGNLGEGGPIALMDVVSELCAMRADTSLWGRQHGVRLEDSHTGLYVEVPHTLGSSTYAALLRVDVSGFDMSSPSTRVEWDDRFNRWVARLVSSPRQVVRRLPTRFGASHGNRVRAVTELEMEAMWRTVSGSSGSVVAWQRTTVVLFSAMGWSNASVAQRSSVSVNRVRSIIANFNADGAASFAPEYRNGQPVTAPASALETAAMVANGNPADYGFGRGGWTTRTLSDFLVGQGFLEDVDPTLLDAFADGSFGSFAEGYLASSPAPATFAPTVER